MLTPFHLAIPVNDLEKNRRFYRDVLGCSEGRSSDHWVDFDFFGHQLVLHYSENSMPNLIYNSVDKHAVPVPHFGVVLAWEIFHQFAESLKKQSVAFIIEPHIRFEGMVGEQATLFFHDPAGNALEFKSFKDPSQLFAH